MVVSEADDDPASRAEVAFGMAVRSEFSRSVRGEFQTTSTKRPARGCALHGRCGRKTLWKAASARRACNGSPGISRSRVMPSFYETAVRPALFRRDSEEAHELGVDALALLGRLAPRAALECWTRRRDGARDPGGGFRAKFPNAVGLYRRFRQECARGPPPRRSASAMSRSARSPPRRSRQPAAPDVSLPAEEAVINRMGFNNEGSAAVAARLAAAGTGRPAHPLGVNLGKSKVTRSSARRGLPRELRAAGGFRGLPRAECLEPQHAQSPPAQDESACASCWPRSPPPTPRAAQPGKVRVPILLKIAPDLTWPADRRGARRDRGIPPRRRDRDQHHARAARFLRPGVNEAGGLSGAPVRRRSTEIVGYNCAGAPPAAGS